MRLSNSKELKKELIAILFKLARKDENFGEQEFLFILKVGETMGISAEDLRTIHLNLKNYKFVTPRDEADRMTILYYMLFCMKSDQKIDNREIDFVKYIGFKLGFRPQLIDDLIRAIQAHVKTKIPPEELLEILRKYLN